MYGCMEIEVDLQMLGLRRKGSRIVVGTSFAEFVQGLEAKREHSMIWLSGLDSMLTLRRGEDALINFRSYYMKILQTIDWCIGKIPRYQVGGMYVIGLFLTRPPP